jgi:hypothetical protein
MYLELFSKLCNKKEIKKHCSSIGCHLKISNYLKDQKKVLPKTNWRKCASMMVKSCFILWYMVALVSWCSLCYAISTVPSCKSFKNCLLIKRVLAENDLYGLLKSVPFFFFPILFSNVNSQTLVKSCVSLCSNASDCALVWCSLVGSTV